MDRTDVLWWNNGGMGDLCMMAPSIKRLAVSGRHVTLYLAKAAPAFLAPLLKRWANVTVLTERPVDLHCDVVACDCDAVTLAARCAHLPHQREVSPRNWDGTPADWARDVADQIGADGPPPAPLEWNVFASSLPHLRMPELVVMGAGHGPNPKAAPKAWDGWWKVCGAVGMPHVWLGPADSYAPPEYDDCPLCGAAIEGGLRYPGGGTAYHEQRCAGHCGWRLRDMRGHTPGVLAVAKVMALGALYVGIDNGLGHLAAAFGLPTMTVFKATDPDRYRPNTLNSVTFGTEGRPPAPEQVAEAVREFLGPAPREPLVSTVIAAHNEGDELLRTVECARLKAGGPVEVIVIADGTRDGSNERLPPWVRGLRREKRVGVAVARMHGTPLATGEALICWDGHQRGSMGYARALAAKALDDGCLVMGAKVDLYTERNPAFGAGMRVDPAKARLAPRYYPAAPPGRYAEATGLVTPCYALPRAVFERIGGWPPTLRGWGQTEVTLSVKLALAGVPMLVDRDTRIYHLHHEEFDYKVTKAEVLRNNYIMCRTCFDADSLASFWLPLMQQHAEWRAELADWDAEAEVHRMRFQTARVLSDEEWFGKALGMSIATACERYLTGERATK